MGRQQTRAIPENKLREIREYEGLSQPELGHLADVSVDTISATENRQRQVKRRIQNKLIRGLNDNPGKRDKNHAYRLEDVFPNG